MLRVEILGNKATDSSLWYYMSKYFLRALSGATLASVLVCTAACSKQAEPTATSAAPKPESAAVAASTLPVVGDAPAFTLKDLEGRDVSSDSFKGKVVVVDFWATWCGPCVEEIPGYVALQERYGKDGLVIVGISLDRRGAEHVKKFTVKHGMNYVVVMGDDAVGEAFGGIAAIPTTILIDRQGKIRHKKVGSMHHDEYEKLLRPLL